MAERGDLNIILKSNPRETEKIVCKAIELGYEMIAVNSTCELTTVKSKREKQNPLGLPSFNWKELPGIKAFMDSNQNINVFSRITVKLEDQSQLHQLASNPFSTFDILAVTPTTEKLFQQCCGSLEVDIISLDITSRLPFYLKIPQVRQAIQRGIHFEIVYSPAIRSTSQRSQAESVLDIRGPNDISNLGLLFGLKEDQCKAAISKNARAVLYHARGRKCTVKSAITGCYINTVPTNEMWKIGKRTEHISNDESDGVQKKKKIKFL
ncbi:Ribonuclease P protein subunit p30 [Exaiptasia diaphana]|nr:Ribonuclease P protein subunit p30 [Exaiptasia diaphana]